MDESYRVSIEVGPDRMEVKSVRKLRMRSPPDQSRRYEGRASTGRFVEIIGDKDELLYRRRLSTLDTRIEYPTGDPAQPFGHGELRRARTVSVIVPARKGARTVKLTEIGSDRNTEPGAAALDGEPGTRARELLSIALPLEGKSEEAN